MDAVIVNFNTTELTMAAVKSIWKHTPRCRVTVFDNSDSVRFPEMDGVAMMDNTDGRFIDFSAFLSEYPDKQLTTNNWGSDKHCKTIDYLWDLFPNGFVLLDSDVLVKRDLTELVDPDKAFAGEVFQDWNNHFHLIPRVLPFCCWINVSLCKKAGIRYFSDERNWRLHNRDCLHWYDTGASFYEDCANKHLHWREINVDDYVEHLGAGSYKNNNSDEWIKKNRNLYE